MVEALPPTTLGLTVAERYEVLKAIDKAANARAAAFAIVFVAIGFISLAARLHPLPAAAPILLAAAMACLVFAAHAHRSWKTERQRIADRLSP
jgi:4-amino-4-deoxy-L-arabinose transferase-like glycosyltransferase